MSGDSMRRGMRVAFGLVLLLCILIGGGYAFMSQASFGKLPEGERLAMRAVPFAIRSRCRP